MKKYQGLAQTRPDIFGTAEQVFNAVEAEIAKK